MHAGERPRTFGALFAEDFDQAQLAPEPEVIEPMFSATELTEARDAAWRDGHAAGLDAAAASDAAGTRRAMEAIASGMSDARDAAGACAEQSADAIARVLLDSLAAAFPTLCARHGEAEVQAIVRAVLPALIQEPAITVRAHERSAPALAREIEQFDPELAAHVQVVECDAMSPGDVRITWRNGAAVRDTASLWQQVAAILMPAGLLRSNAAIMETVDGQ